MSNVVGPEESDSATVADGSAIANVPDEQATMKDIKEEKVTSDVAPGVADVPEAKNKNGEDVEAEADSEAETWIQSPEKKKAAVDKGLDGQSTQSSTVKPDDATSPKPAPDSESRSRKRKRNLNDGPDDRASKSSSRHSSPLSSPGSGENSLDSASEVSDLDESNRRAGARSKRSAPSKTESEDAEEKAANTRIRRRRPSDIQPPVGRQRQKNQNNNAEGISSERRETRSATYPRHSSEDRSPSPRPVSKREHRRGASTQFTPGEFERRKRGRPPLINTRRNQSVDRAESVSSNGSNSPPRTRPSLHKLTSQDHDNISPAKVTGPRKWRDKNGRTFLSRACNNNDLETARLRFAERPEDLNLADNAGNTPLQIAALEGFVDIVRFLLESGCEVDTRNIDKETPLIDAVENGHLEVIKLLLDHGANPRLGNAKGDEPYELVPQDDENYKIIRKLLADAKEHDVKRRKSNDNIETNREGGSSRAASAASPRDSPPIHGARSPPPIASRRRTGRSESTRNDLLWQANTQENLTRLAAKGDVQGVASILNILQKAETESLIAAAKAGHEEVLQYLLGMGDPDPDPDPVASLKPGFNTPILAAIGRGNPDVIKLLVEQSGFNPARKFKGKTYYEIASDRKGEEWVKEVEILKSAYEKNTQGKVRKQVSPRKSRDLDKTKPKPIGRSSSPPAARSLRPSTSPAMTHKTLPTASSERSKMDRRQEPSSPESTDRRKVGSRKENGDSVAISSDHEPNTSRKGQKVRRSQSDVSQPPNLDSETSHKRRRLVTGKEHRRRKSMVGEGSSGGEDGEIEVKREGKQPGLKRPRASLSPERPPDEENDSGRAGVKKRRTVVESSPEESRPSLKKQPQNTPKPEEPREVEIQSEGKMSSVKDEATSSNAASSSQSKTNEVNTTPAGEDPQNSKGEDAPNVVGTAEEGKADTQPPSQTTDVEMNDAALQEEEAKKKAQAEAEAQAAEEERRRAAEEAEQIAKAAEEAKRLEEERVAAEKAAEEKRLAEEAEALRKAEEEALARKQEEERQEQIRREREQRQKEELARQQEIERRRREALPALLCKSALLLDSGNPTVKAAPWLAKFLPLFTVRTQQLEQSSISPISEEEWLPNFQVAGLLGTKDLKLQNYTSLETRPVTIAERDRLWKVARNMLSFDYEANSVNTSIKQAIQKEEEERPKFFAMEELFWVKVCLP